MKARVVHCRKEAYDVLIDRTTKWGNPFRIERYSPSTSREEVVVQHKVWLTERMKREPELRGEIERELGGKVCGCWCAPLPCHGDFLMAVANGEE